MRVMLASEILGEPVRALLRRFYAGSAEIQPEKNPD